MILKNVKKAVFDNKSYIMITLITIALIIVVPANTIIYSFKMPNFPLSEVCRSINKVSLIIFIFFMLISDSLTYKIKNIFGRMLLIANNEKIHKSIFFSLIFFDFILWAIIFLFQTILFIKYGKQNYKFLIEISLDSFAYIFICGVIGILIGILISNIKKEVFQYITILIIALMVSPIKELILNGKLLFLERMLQILPMDINMSYDYMIGNHVRAWQLTLLILWIGILCSLHLCFVYRKKLQTLIALIISVILLIFNNYIGYESREDQFTDSESIYYSIKDNYSKYELCNVDNQFEAENSEFEIKKYSLKIKIRNKLNITSEITIENSGTKDLTFTLYKRFTIEEITDQNGNSLDFVKDGDWITVKTNDNTEKIVFKYEGKCSPLLSDYSSTALYAGFPWYPYPGKQYIYGLKNIEGTDIIADGYCRCYNNISKIELDIDAPYIIYCNLENNGNDSFSGNTDSLMLVGGNYKKVEVDNYEIVYPIELEYYPSYVSGISEWNNNVIKYAKSKEVYDGYIIYGNSFIFSSSSDAYQSVIGNNLIMYNGD
jgi:hypothetical protein